MRRLLLYTPVPGEGGRYSIQVLAPRSRRGALPYHLQVARAGEDDTATWPARQRRVRGSLRGEAPTSSTCTGFEVRRPSILDLRMKTGSSEPVQPAPVG